MKAYLRNAVMFNQKGQGFYINGGLETFYPNLGVHPPIKEVNEHFEYLKNIGYTLVDQRRAK